MAEKRKGHWRNVQRNKQVDDTINDLSRLIKDKSIPTDIVNKLGNALNKYDQFNEQYNWEKEKKGTNSNKTLVMGIVHSSKRTFTSREIFLHLLESWDAKKIQYIKKNELTKTLKTLSNKSGKYCSLEDLKEDGMIPQHEESCNMFETLSSVFGEEPDMVRQKIEKALLQERNNFKKYDANQWITRPLSENWDPIVFYICANIQKCVISILADATHEYQIFPDETSKLPLIRFGRLEHCKFVYLGSEATDETGVNNVEDYKELRNYLEEQLEDLTDFCNPESTEIIKEQAPSFDQKILLKKHKEKIDEIMHDSRKQNQKLLEQNQTIEEIQETTNDFSEILQQANAINEKLQKQVDGLKRQSETKTKQPHDKQSRHTEKKLDVYEKPESQKKICWSKTQQGAKQIKFNDTTCSQSYSPKTQLEDIKRPPPNDETQRQMGSPQTKPEARNENVTDKEKAQTESFKTKAETDTKLKKKKKPSLITRLSDELKKGSDVSSSPEPRTGSPAKSSNSTTTFTPHC